MKRNRLQTRPGAHAAKKGKRSPRYRPRKGLRIQGERLLHTRFLSGSMAFLPFLAKATSGFKEEASLLLFLFLYPAFHYIRSREEGEVSLVYLALSPLTLASDERIPPSPEKFRPSLVTSCSFCAKKVVSLTHPTFYLFP